DQRSVERLQDLEDVPAEHEIDQPEDHQQSGGTGSQGLAPTDQIALGRPVVRELNPVQRIDAGRGVGKSVWNNGRRSHIAPVMLGRLTLMRSNISFFDVQRSMSDVRCSSEG